MQRDKFDRAVWSSVCTLPQAMEGKPPGETSKSTEKHGGDSIILWDCILPATAEKLVRVDGEMSGGKYMIKKNTTC